MPLATPPKFELQAIRALAEIPGRRVLEIGSGNGRLTRLLAREAARWAAVDIDTPGLLEARRKRLPPNVHLVRNGGGALSFSDASFDLVLFTWSLCCLPPADMPIALVEARRVLGSNGELFDIHPTDEPPMLEIWHTRYSHARADFSDLETVDRVPMGWLEQLPTTCDFTAATDALVIALEKGFTLLRSFAFDYRYFFDHLDDITQKMKHEPARLPDDLYQRAQAEIKRATTPVKMVVVQRCVLTLMQKLS